MGICDKEVIQVLKSRLQPRNINDIELDRTVVICSSCAECDDINEECLERLAVYPYNFLSLLCWLSEQIEQGFHPSLQVHSTIK